MSQRYLTLVLGFVAGICFAVPFMAFRSPAAAVETLTLQQVSERLAKAEARLARFPDSTYSLGDQVQSIQLSVDNLNVEVRSLRNAQNGSALNTLQENLVALQSAVGGLKTGFNKHVHYAKYSNSLDLPAIQCKVLNDVCTWLGGGNAVALPGSFVTDIPLNPVP